MNDNVNPEEIKKFSALADSWWNPEGEMKPLHLLNPLRFDYVTCHATLSGATALDVGCGGGILTESLAKAGAKTTGIDLSEDVLQAAKTHAENSNLLINYQQTSVEALAAQQPASFDIITCMEMLEHVPQPEKIIQACATLLKPGGKLFLSTLNRTPKAFLTAIIGAEYLLNMLPKGTHHYADFIRPSELDCWAKAAKLELKNISGIRYSLLKQSFSLCQRPEVNYISCYTL